MKPLKAFLILIPVLPLLAVLMIFPTAPARGGDMPGDYAYWEREDLAEWWMFQTNGYAPPHPFASDKPEVPKLMGKKVVTVDQLAVVWRSNQEYKPAWIKFDTRFLRCIVSSRNGAAMDVLLEVDDKTYGRGDDPDGSGRLIEFAGSFQRLELHGDIKDEALRSGVDTERIWFVVDQIARPSATRAEDFAEDR